MSKNKYCFSWFKARESNFTFLGKGLFRPAVKKNEKAGLTLSFFSLQWLKMVF
jgi:hypothetical protein